MKNASCIPYVMTYFYLFIWYKSKVRLSVAGEDSLYDTSHSHSGHIPDCAPGLP